MPVVKLPSGQELSYYESGAKDAPAIVFIHALFMDGTMWEHQTSKLSDRFRCLALDTRGHGLTPASSEFTTSDVVNDLVSLLDLLSIDRASIVGVSQGGWLALETALAHPHRVKSIAFCSSSVRKQSAESLAGLHQLRSIWQDAGIDSIMGPFVSIAFGDGFTDPVQIKRWRDAADKRGDETRVLAFNSAMSRNPLDSKLSNFTHPSLVLHGAADRSFPSEEADYAKQVLGDAVKSFKVVEDGAHVLPVTHPEQTNEHLIPFLDKFAA